MIISGNGGVRPSSLILEIRARSNPAFPTKREVTKVLSICRLERWISGFNSHLLDKIARGYAGVNIRLSHERGRFDFGTSCKRYIGEMVSYYSVTVKSADRNRYIPQTES